MTLKIMILIFWRFLGIHVVEALPHGEKFNSFYFRDIKM
jgi:hypothetical protein